MMALLPLLMTLLLAQTTPSPAAAPTVDPADYGTVEGTLIWASQSRPLEGIPVYLRKAPNTGPAENNQDAQRRGVSVSDPAGRFLLKDIPPGDYIVVTERRGYFRENDA